MFFALNVTFILTLVTAFSIQLPTSIFVAYVACLGYWLLDVKMVKITDAALFLIVVFIFMLGSLTFNHQSTPFIYLCLTPLVFLAALNFGSQELKFITKVLSSSFWIIFGVIGLAAAINRHEPEPLGAIFPWASTNGIPSYLIVVQAAYSLAFYFNYNRLPVASTFATFSVAYLGLGRGSIVVAALIVCLTLAVNLFWLHKQQNNGQRIIKFVAPIAALAIAFTTDWIALYDQLQSYLQNSKFSTGVYDEHRMIMIREYISSTSAIGILFGQSYEGTAIDMLYGGNPHNSFIRVHSFYGLIPLLIVLLPLYTALTARRDRIQKLILMSMCALVLLRATTEPILFPTPLDFFYILYFILFFNFSKSADDTEVTST